MNHPFSWRPMRAPAQRTCSALAVALALTLAGCATPGSQHTSAAAPASSGNVSREMAKLELKATLADDAHWERVLSLPRSHPRFAVMRDTLRDNVLNDDTLTWFAIAAELQDKHPEVSTTTVYYYNVSQGQMRLSDAQAEAYLRVRALPFERMDETQCTQYFDGKLPNRTAWSVAATLDDAEAAAYYRIERTTFALELQRAPTRPLPSTQDLGKATSTLKVHFNDKSIGDSGLSRCRTTAAWMRSFESLKGSERNAMVTLLLSALTSADTKSLTGSDAKDAKDKLGNGI